MPVIQGRTGSNSDQRRRLAAGQRLQPTASTEVGATLIAAPRSTKTHSGEYAPAMHQSRTRKERRPSF